MFIIRVLILFSLLVMGSVAMGRCQSTPGLVETKGRVSIEDMWLCHSSAPPISYNQQSLIRYRTKQKRSRNK